MLGAWSQTSIIWKWANGGSTSCLPSDLRKQWSNGKLQLKLEDGLHSYSTVNSPAFAETVFIVWFLRVFSSLVRRIHQSFLLHVKENTKRYSCQSHSHSLSDATLVGLSSVKSGKCSLRLTYVKCTVKRIACSAICKLYCQHLSSLECCLLHTWRQITKPRRETSLWLPGLLLSSRPSLSPQLSIEKNMKQWHLKEKFSLRLKVDNLIC